MIEKNSKMSGFIDFYLYFRHVIRGFCYAFYCNTEGR